MLIINVLPFITNEHQTRHNILLLPGFSGCLKLILQSNPLNPAQDSTTRHFASAPYINPDTWKHLLKPWARFWVIAIQGKAGCYTNADGLPLLLMHLLVLFTVKTLSQQKERKRNGTRKNQTAVIYLPCLSRDVPRGWGVGDIHDKISIT